MIWVRQVSDGYCGVCEVQVGAMCEGQTGGAEEVTEREFAGFPKNGRSSKENDDFWLAGKEAGLLKYQTAVRLRTVMTAACPSHRDKPARQSASGGKATR